MTTPSTPRKAGPLLGTGAQTSWPFTFKVFAASDIAVTVANNLGVETALVLNADYSVTLNSNQETSPGGTVTYPLSGSPLPTGSKLTIVGNLPYDQPLDLPSGGNFSPLALENQLDRLTMQIQQLREQVGRSLTVPVSSTTTNVALPQPEPNELIGWDSTGNNLQNFALSELATAVAYATMRYDTFTGDGATTQFTLTADPVTLANLDVAISGVTQVPGSDYSLVNGVLVFTSAPPNGAEVLARYGEGLVNVGGDSSDIRFLQAGVNAVDRTAESKLREFVNVNDFGADPTGTVDSTVEIQAALDASLQVEFNGNYKISGSLTLRSGHSLRSTNKRSKLIRNTSVTPFDMIVGVSVTDITIANLWFDGVAKTPVTIVANRYCAIRLWDNGTAIQCERITISNCRFDKTTSAENQSEGVRGVVMLEQCSDVEVSNCQFYDNRGTCIFWWNSTNNVRVSDCYCLGEQLPYDPTFQRMGSFVSGKAEGVSVSNCRIKDTGYTSINISGNGIAVTGCVIQTPNYAGITIAEGIPAATNVAISGCSFTSPNQDGIAVFLVDGLSISGCTFSGANTSGRAGVQVFNTTTGVIAKNITISGCQFTNNTSVGVGLRAGQNVNVTGNTFISNGTGFFSRNLSGAASSVYFVNNVVVDSANIAFELNSAATSAQTAYVANNTFVSTDIATLQEYGVLSSGANSTVILGQNSFSNNYDVASISFSFTAGKGLLALSSGVVQQLKIVSGFPLRSEWNQKHITMGTWEFWVDGTGDLRMKNGAPTSDTDGVVVGTQT